MVNYSKLLNVSFLEFVKIGLTPLLIDFHYVTLQLEHKYFFRDLVYEVLKYAEEHRNEEILHFHNLNSNLVSILTNEQTKIQNYKNEDYFIIEDSKLEEFLHTVKSKHDTKSVVEYLKKQGLEVNDFHTFYMYTFYTGYNKKALDEFPYEKIKSNIYLYKVEKFILIMLCVAYKKVHPAVPIKYFDTIDKFFIIKLFLETNYDYFVDTIPSDIFSKTITEDNEQNRNNLKRIMNNEMKTKIIEKFKNEYPESINSSWCNYYNPFILQSLFFGSKISNSDKILFILSMRKKLYKETKIIYSVQDVMKIYLTPEDIIEINSLLNKNKAIEGYSFLAFSKFRDMIKEYLFLNKGATIKQLFEEMKRKFSNTGDTLLVKESFYLEKYNKGNPELKKDEHIFIHFLTYLSVLRKEDVPFIKISKKPSSLIEYNSLLLIGYNSVEKYLSYGGEEFKKTLNFEILDNKFIYDYVSLLLSELYEQNPSQNHVEHLLVYINSMYRPKFESLDQFINSYKDKLCFTQTETLKFDGKKFTHTIYDIVNIYYPIIPFLINPSSETRMDFNIKVSNYNYGVIRYYRYSSIYSSRLHKDLASIENNFYQASDPPICKFCGNLKLNNEKKCSKCNNAFNVHDPTHFINPLFLRSRKAYNNVIYLLKKYSIIKENVSLDDIDNIFNLYRFILTILLYNKPEISISSTLIVDKMQEYEEINNLEIYKQNEKGEIGIKVRDYVFDRKLIVNYNMYYVLIGHLNRVSSEIEKYIELVEQNFPFRTFYDVIYKALTGVRIENTQKDIFEKYLKIIEKTICTYSGNEEERRFIIEEFLKENDSLLNKTKVEVIQLFNSFCRKFGSCVRESYLDVCRNPKLYYNFMSRSVSYIDWDEVTKNKNNIDNLIYLLSNYTDQEIMFFMRNTRLFNNRKELIDEFYKLCTVKKLRFRKDYIKCRGIYDLFGEKDNPEASENIVFSYGSLDDSICFSIEDFISNIIHEVQADEHDKGARIKIIKETIEKETFIDVEPRIKRQRYQFFGNWVNDRFVEDSNSAIYIQRKKFDPNYKLPEGVKMIYFIGYYNLGNFVKTKDEEIKADNHIINGVQRFGYISNFSVVEKTVWVKDSYSPVISYLTSEGALKEDLIQMDDIIEIKEELNLIISDPNTKNKNIYHSLLNHVKILTAEYEKIVSLRNNDTENISNIFREIKDKIGDEEKEIFKEYLVECYKYGYRMRGWYDGEVEIIEDGKVITKLFENEPVPLTPSLTKRILMEEVQRGRLGSFESHLSKYLFIINKLREKLSSNEYLNSFISNLRMFRIVKRALDSEREVNFGSRSRQGLVKYISVQMKEAYKELLEKELENSEESAFNNIELNVIFTEKRINEYLNPKNMAKFEKMLYLSANLMKLEKEYLQEGTILKFYDDSEKEINYSIKSDITLKTQLCSFGADEGAFCIRMAAPYIIVTSYLLLKLLFSYTFEDSRLEVNITDASSYE